MNESLKKDVECLNGEIKRDDDSDLDQNQAPVQRRLNQRQRELGAEEALGIGPGEHVIAREDVVSMDDRAAHDAMKARLMVQFNQALKKGEVYWPKRSGGVPLAALCTKHIGIKRNYEVIISICPISLLLKYNDLIIASRRIKVNNKFEL
jgi:hypothetical protein